jgi:Uma2 family endonuclease
MIRPTNSTTISRNDYPTSDGRPFDSDLHRDLMLALIETLRWWFRDDPTVYATGNLLVYYEKDNMRVHVSPDVFVVPGVGNRTRDNYLLWEEGRGLDLVIELTSKTTMIEDIEEKYNLYVSKLGVKEYFLFDPEEEYLKPSFQGYRKVKTRFRPIDPVDGRLPSDLLRMHLERDGIHLRLWDPATGERLPTPTERAERAEAEAAQLREELARLRRAKPGGGNGK